MKHSGLRRQNKIEIRKEELRDIVTVSKSNLYLIGTPEFSNLNQIES